MGPSSSAAGSREWFTGLSPNLRHLLLSFLFAVNGSGNKAMGVQGLYPFSEKPEKKERFSFPASLPCRAKRLAGPSVLACYHGGAGHEADRRGDGCELGGCPELYVLPVLDSLCQLGFSIWEWPEEVRGADCEVLRNEHRRSFTEPGRSWPVSTGAWHPRKWGKGEEQWGLFSEAPLDHTIICETCWEWNTKNKHLQLDEFRIELFVAGIRTVISYR